MKTFARLEKNKSSWFLLTALFSFFLLRLPSLFEPYWYGDEGVYQTLGAAIRSGRLLYRDIFDNKPPLLYLLYSVLDSDQFATKMASLIFGLLSILVFFFLAKKLFTPSVHGSKIHYYSTIVFALFFGLPLIEGNIANAENFMQLPILVACLLIVNQIQTATHRKFHSEKLFFIAGFLVSIAFLFKVVAIFDLAALIVFVIIASLHQRLPLKNINHILNKIVPLAFGFAIPIISTALFFLINGALIDFLQATFVQNIGYVGYGNKFLAPHSLLFLKSILLFIFVLFIFKIRKLLSLTTIFILIWFAFSVFNAFFSERPFPHYLLVLLPSFSLMLGLMFWDKKYQKIITLFLFITMILVLSNFHFFDKSTAYYQNFINYILNKKSSTAYRAFFDKKTSTDYEIGLFLKPKISNNDSIFIWGNNAQLYKIIGALPPGKYVVSYHIRDYKDGILNTENAINKVKPRFILIMPDQNNIPFLLSRYSARIKIGDALIYERVL